ncbi:hypothetical protein PM082_012514 [Marasmius tenuissimus]|nr:hypothetical protein PM082_012514 [Marasmius tenuissimus]
MAANRCQLGRCYLIWGRRRRVVAVPGLLCLLNNFGNSLESGSLYPLNLSIYFTFTLVRMFGVDWRDYERANRIDTVLDVCFQLFYFLMVPIMGIASTLIIVRTAQGKAIDNQESFKTIVLGESGGESREAPAGAVDSIVDTQRSTHGSMGARRNGESAAQ